MNMTTVYQASQFRLLAVVCSLIMLSACATGPGVSPESLVEERAKARWEAYFSGDLAGSYEYLTPGYRSSVSSLQYQRSVLIKRVAYTNADYMGSSCEATSCTVKFNVGFSISGALPGVKSHKGTQIIEETWVLIDGQWYLVPS
jgi:hypothetical protein